MADLYPGNLYLGIDTATSHLALALWSPTDGAFATCEEVGREHARRVVGALDALLARAGATRQDLCGIGVGTGPGSYTGLRVGVATAQGLARGLGVPLVGASTLAAIAYGVLDDTTPKAVVALDARRGNLYAAAFWLEAGELVMQGGAEKIARDAVATRYPGWPLLEGFPPDPHYLARMASRTPTSTAPVTPLYL